MIESKKSKLLFIPYTFTNGGGAEKVLQLLVNNIPQNDYDVSIQEIEQFDKFLELNGNIKLNYAFFHQTYPSKSFNELNYILLIHFPKILKDIFKLNNYDSVITFNYQLPSFMLPAFNNEKKIAWIHGDLYDLLDESKSYEKKLQKNAWKNTDKIIAISKKSLQSLYDVFPEFKEKAKIIHNGTDIDQLQKKCKENCDINCDYENNIICIGRLDENKNNILVVRAVSILIKQGISCNLLLVGIGKEKENLINEAKKLGIYDKIHFIGFQKNPYKYLVKSKVLCMSSFSEGWPTVVAESMALGIPFVATPVAGASDEMADNQNCGLISNYTPEDYAEKIKTLLTQKDLYEKMSKNCINHVKEYSIENYVKSFINQLNEIPENKVTKISNSIFPNIIYFILYILSIGEIIFRFQIILKRIREKKIIKIIKNIIYLFGIIILIPIMFIGKIFYYPLYINNIKRKNN